MPPAMEVGREADRVVELEVCSDFTSGDVVGPSPRRDIGFTGEMPIIALSANKDISAQNASGINEFFCLWRAMKSFARAAACGSWRPERRRSTPKHISELTDALLKVDNATATDCEEMSCCVSVGLICMMSAPLLMDCINL